MGTGRSSSLNSCSFIRASSVKKAASGQLANGAKRIGAPAFMCVTRCYRGDKSRHTILGYAKPNTPISIVNHGNAKSGGGVVSVHIITGSLCPIPAHSHFGAIMPETLGEPTLGDDWCWRAEAEGEANAGDGHSATLSTQSASE